MLDYKVCTVLVVGGDHLRGLDAHRVRGGHHQPGPFDGDGAFQHLEDPGDVEQPGREVQEDAFRRRGCAACDRVVAVGDQDLAAVPAASQRRQQPGVGHGSEELGSERFVHVWAANNVMLVARAKQSPQVGCEIQVGFDPDMAHLFDLISGIRV